MGLKDIWLKNLYGGERVVKAVVKGVLRSDDDTPRDAGLEVFADGFSHELSEDCWCQPRVVHVHSEANGTFRRKVSHNLVSGESHRVDA